jgi:hypothetical protein
LEEVFKEVRTRFDGHVTSDGATFPVLIRVDLFARA